MAAGHTTVMARRAAIVALLAAAVAVIYLTFGAGGDHQVRVAFDDALNIVSGASVQAAGVDVGSVTDVKHIDGQAVLTLNIGEAVWPLPQGTTAAIRLASVSGNVNRRIDLAVGPRGAPPIAEGGQIAASAAGPVELDDVLQIFNRNTRSNLRGTLASVSGALDGHTGQLNAGLHQLAPAMGAFGGLMSDLNQSQSQLSSLLTRGNAVTSVLARHQQQLGDMITVAGSTLDTFARHSSELQRTLDALPPALTQVDYTAGRLHPTLRLVTSLLQQLRPGVAQLAPLAAVATPTLRALRITAGQGVHVVRDVTAAAPGITRLLVDGTPFVKRLTPAVTQTTPIVHCLRPYTPEAAGLISNWASWNKAYDASSHIGKIFVNAGPGSVFDNPTLPMSSLNKLGFGYALLRPPGYIGGKPQFMPECGLTPAGLDPANDWDKR
jgi:phospholipid/cholesterol/gamma-HCH transport system substrate-binding protein